MIMINDSEMLLNNPESIYDLEDCRFTLKVFETEAYSAVINALRAQGPFSQYYHLILEHLRIILNVSIDRHKAEIRRALADPTLLRVATCLNSQTDVTFEWSEEAKRSSGNATFPTALALESPSFYRFNFLRTCKNDLLLELADHLAMMAVHHNRSKSLENGEDKMFQALKKPKYVPSIGNREEIDGQMMVNKTTEIPTPVIKTAPATTSKSRVQSASAKRKAVQKEAAAMAARKTPTLSTPSTPVATTPAKKYAGRPRKQVEDLPVPKQRLGQIIAARSAVAVRGHGTSGFSQRGRGAKRVPKMTKAALTAGTHATQRPATGQIGSPHGLYHQPTSQLYGGHYPQAQPRTPPRQMPILTPSTPPVVNNQPGSGQKTSSGRQIRKRPTFTGGPVPTWPTAVADLQSRFGSSGGRVPVAPLSMLPASIGAMSMGSGGGQSRFFTGPASPTRASLTGEAPGVYADDYNANAVDSSDTISAVHSSPESHLQPNDHQFFSSLSATYFAQNAPPPPPKTRRFSPGSSTSLSTHMIPSTRLTGITVKAKSGSGSNGNGNSDGSAMTSGNMGLGSATLPVRQNSGQKLIVLPSAILRRPQAAGGAPPLTPETLKSSPSQGGKQQSVIIVRRAPSLPSAAAASSSSVMSTSSTPTPSSTPAPTTPTMSTPPDTLEDTK